MAATEKLSDRIEAEIGCWPKTSTLCAVLRDAYAAVKAVEDAPEALASEDYEGDAQVILFSVREHYALIGKRVKLVVCDE